MCKLKSVIVLKDKVYCPDHDSHQKMLEELGIEDMTENAMRRFVRCELSPKAGDNYASNISGWIMEVDQDILPDWWDANTYRPMVEDTVREWQSKHVIASGEADVRDGVYYAYGSAMERANGSAMVRANDYATVRAYDYATVHANDYATVRAYGSATVYAYDSATVDAYDYATVYAYGSATVDAYGSATVYAYGSATVDAYDYATVIIRAYSKVSEDNIALADNAVLINHRDLKIICAKEYEVENNGNEDRRNAK